MNQSEFLAITCKLLKAQENSRAQGASGIGFSSHWLNTWRKISQPITNHMNRGISFDSHLKTAPPITAVIIITLISIISSVLIKIPSILINNTDILQYYLV